MIWKEYSETLKELLGLEGSPIAVTYSMTPVEGADEGKRPVCRALIEARSGKVINLTRESCSCPGGIWHLGLGPRPTGKLMEGLKRFLVDGEKLFCTLATAGRTFHLTTAAPEGLAENVILSPLEKSEWAPDLVVFLCNPEQACRLLWLAMYPSGIPPKVEMAGSTCHMVIAYPVVTGELNISLMDYTDRKARGYGADELFVTVPYHLMPGLIWSIDKCTAGTANMGSDI